MIKIVPGICHPLYGVATIRQIEQRAQARLQPNTLMQRAGLAVAKLALAIAPHAQRIWIACGPGNNGGDGLEAALNLHKWGKQTSITWLGKPESAPWDATAAYQRIRAAGLTVELDPPTDFDLGIDALLGIGGQSREPEGRLADWIQLLNAKGTKVLAVDIPSGLNADTGSILQLHVKATHTLSLLTLKPGLLTAHGRDATGTLWLDDLGVCPQVAVGLRPNATLAAAPIHNTRLHDSHKGSYGDVAVIGGASGMTGAALLAASAALHAGAGRVFVSLLVDSTLNVDWQQPELMFRSIEAFDFSAMIVVCGCGGGQVVNTWLPKVLDTLSPIVVDADAITAIANSNKLQTALTNRSERFATTVLTPHPLEAARLLETTAQQVQQDRLAAAQALSTRFACTVVLKGSGTIIASPGEIPVINPTGNARLATAGTGDVLAGMVGARLASGATGFAAACAAVYQHGQLCDQWPADRPLTAGAVASSRRNCV